MSVSCVGTCSNCAVQRFWLSHTFSLQLDDGHLVCLPHPGETWNCEKYGLTLGQASKRGRLYRETFYVCRNCGREGQTIEKAFRVDSPMVSVRSAMKWCWGSALFLVPPLVWIRWWEATLAIGGTLLIWPVFCWLENRKALKELALRGLPRADAPGQFPIPEPTQGRDPDRVVGRVVTEGNDQWRATGACCDKPDWINAGCASDEDRIPCHVCRKGIMQTSEHAIH